jgi:hypothetical protein
MTGLFVLNLFRPLLQLGRRYERLYILFSFGERDPRFLIHLHARSEEFYGQIKSRFILQRLVKVQLPPDAGGFEVSDPQNNEIGILFSGLGIRPQILSRSASRILSGDLISNFAGRSWPLRTAERRAIARSYTSRLAAFNRVLPGRGVKRNDSDLAPNLIVGGLMTPSSASL